MLLILQKYGAYIKPQSQPAMVLSRYYVSKENNTMPHRFGDCELTSFDGVLLNLVQKGKFRFTAGSPILYYPSYFYWRLPWVCWLSYITELYH